METRLFTDDSDLQEMQGLLAVLGPGAAVVDFEESMRMDSIHEVTRLWWSASELTAFAYVDAWNNLWFELRPGPDSVILGREIVAWGIKVMKHRNLATGNQDSLDASCRADDTIHLPVLLREGFIETDVRSLRFERSLEIPVEDHPLPRGFIIRAAREDEVEDLVALHRAAFGTDQMTVEHRLAIMRAPGYQPELDLLAISPQGNLAAFCICGWEEEENEKIGYTDPVGTHPRFQRLGLCKALISHGLNELRNLGIHRARIGTSSENKSMQRLAEGMGFRLVEEKMWLSRQI